jgi:hypothetical protein
VRKRLDFDCGNNGQVPFSHGDAEKILHASWRRAANAIAELEHFGFIKQRNGGEPGVNIRLASEWQLTAFDCGGQEASKTFLRWDGTAFTPTHRAKVGTATKEMRTAATETQLKNSLPPATRRRPRLQHDGADSVAIEKSTQKDPKTACNTTALSVSPRLQHEGTSTNTTQGRSEQSAATRAAGAVPLAARRRVDRTPRAGAQVGFGLGSEANQQTPPPQTTYRGKPTLQMRTLEFLRANGRSSRADVITAFNVHPGEAQRALNVLCRRGLAERIRHGVYQAVRNQS